MTEGKKEGCKKEGKKEGGTREWRATVTKIGQKIKDDDAGKRKIVS